MGSDWYHCVACATQSCACCEYRSLWLTSSAICPLTSGTSYGYTVVERWKLGGPGGWDCLVADPTAKRLYVTRGDRVVVKPLRSGSAIGVTPVMNGGDLTRPFETAFALGDGVLVATMERCRQIALGEGLHFVYLGNVPGHPGANTYCPKCNLTLIERSGMFTTANRLFVEEFGDKTIMGSG